MDSQGCAYDGSDGHGALVRTPEADVGRTLTHDDPENLSLCWFQCALVTSSGVGMAFGGGRTGTCHITHARQIWKAAAETGEERRGPSIVMQGRGAWDGECRACGVPMRRSCYRRGVVRLYSTGCGDCRSAGLLA